MADEPDVITPPTVVDQPSTAESEHEQPVDLEALAKAEAEGYEPEGESEEPAEELEEFEWNGKAIKGPKGLKDGVLMQADYTRKTQEVAATRRELEAREARLQEQARASEEYIEMKAYHRALQRDLSAYENVDWNAWSLQDPIACQQGYIAYQNLQREAGELSQRISQADLQRSAETQQETARRLHETHEFAKQNIKGWSDDRARKVIEFATTDVEKGGLGYTKEQLQNGLDPRSIKTLHLAELGSQVLNKSAAPKIPQKAPLTVVGGKSSASVRKPLSEMSMEEYAAFRKRQEAAKRG